MAWLSRKTSMLTPHVMFFQAEYNPRSAFVCRVPERPGKLGNRVPAPKITGFFSGTLPEIRDPNMDISGF